MSEPRGSGLLDANAAKTGSKDSRLALTAPLLRRLLQGLTLLAILYFAVGEPFLYNFGTDSDGGWSALQLITTSNISMHGDNRIGSMYFDIFSCKPYDQSVVLKMIDERFKPKFRKVNFLYRDAPHDDLTGKTNELTVGR